MYLFKQAPSFFVSLCWCTFIAMVHVPSWAQNTQPTTFSSKEQALDFLLIEVSMRENVAIDLLRQAFEDIQWQNLAKQYMVPAPQANSARKNWTTYRANAIHPVRIDNGKKFFREHRVFLEQLEKEFGIPGAVIVAILGIETNYGRNMGSFPVRDVLATFAFDYPPSANQTSRSAMFKEQLYDHILNCLPSDVASTQEIKSFTSCLVQEGSFAGAMGMPQFMPSSIRKYARDGDGNGLIELRKSPQDAMQSIAQFLQAHGWHPGEPIYLPIATVMQSSQVVKELADGDPNPKYTLGNLKNQQVITQWPPSLNENSPALIVDLPSIQGSGNTSVEYVIGLKNFEVITRYNRSFFYAMSVTDFSQAVVSSTPVKKSSKPEKSRSTGTGPRDRKQ